MTIHIYTYDTYPGEVIRGDVLAARKKRAGPVRVEVYADQRHDIARLLAALKAAGIENSPEPELNPTDMF